MSECTRVRNGRSPVRPSRWQAQRAAIVWSINSSEAAPPRSRCLLMVIAQESAQSLAALNRPGAADVRTPREQQDVALPLMIPLGMEMFDILAQRSPPGALAKEDHRNGMSFTARPEKKHKSSYFPELIGISPNNLLFCVSFQLGRRRAC